MRLAVHGLRNGRLYHYAARSKAFDSLGEVKEIESQEERYDIGCYQKHDELAEKGNALELIKQGARVPFCIEGGMFRVNRCCQLNY